VAPGPTDRLWAVLRLDGQRGALMPWVPVFLGIGVGIYFVLPVEPSVTGWAGLAGALALCLWIIWRGGWRFPWLAAVALVLAGLCLAGLRSATVAAPVLDWRYYGPVQGRIVEIDRSASDKPRLTLDRIVLERVAPADTPRRVRVSLHGQQGWIDPRPGQVLLVTAHLGPPQGPVEPGGFDFQRMAWFEGLGAVGYARTPALLWDDTARDRPVGRLRHAIADHVRAVLSGARGAFAATITTGDRAAIPSETLDALRKANLAHLLAISGLHMGLMTGVAFSAIRALLAAVPGLALRRPIKKYAAVGALAVGAFYLALSGGNVATQRAFVMAAVMLLAVCLDRRAITLGAVAVAATIILVLRPEALTRPGFQMSFAATTALVAAFRAWRDHGPSGGGRWVKAAVAVVLSSGVAGLATAPYAASHFNMVPHYGLVANVLTVPLMGAVVMPAALLAGVLAPFGLSWVGLEVMGPAIGWILWVAQTVSDWPHAVSRVIAPPGAVLPLLSLGMLFLVLWQGRARFAGLVPAVAAMVLWTGAERPDFLIAPTGGLIGAWQEDGRILSKPRGDGFAARTWLENDGMVPDQEAASLWDASDTVTFRRAGFAVTQIMGRDAPPRARAACARDDVVVLRRAIPGLPGRCRVIDEDLLRRTGALAIWLDAGGAQLVAARHVTGRRPWNRGGAWLEHLPELGHPAHEGSLQAQITP